MQDESTLIRWTTGVGLQSVSPVQIQNKNINALAYPFAFHIPAVKLIGMNEVRQTNKRGHMLRPPHSRQIYMTV